MIFGGEELARLAGGRLLRDGPAGAVSTDTRSLRPGDWFLALAGERFDGHDFLGSARERGAAGAVVSRLEAVPPGWEAGLVLVPDTLIALQELAAGARRAFGGPVVGITGSAGKTTTRALAALALSPLGPVHQSAGNLNNHVGLPLSVLAAPPGARAWVLEMGMSAPGEIQRLQEIAAPTVRLVTNVGPAHLEGLGGIEGVARGKAELFEGARPGDVLCVNLDDPWVRAMPRPPGTRVLSYGSEQGCDLRLLGVELEVDPPGTRLWLDWRGRREAWLPVPGRFLALDALAALAVAEAVGVEPEAAVDALADYRPVGRRMRLEEHPRGFRVLDDAYNANPASMRAALDTLAALPGRRVAVLGDMLELGEEEIALHREVLEHALSLELQRVAACGPRMAAAAEGLEDPRLLVAPELGELAERLGPELGPGDLVLLKGSRGMAMERFLQLVGGEAPERGT